MDEKELNALKEQVATLTTELEAVKTKSQQDTTTINNQQSEINSLKDKHTQYLEKLTQFTNTNEVKPDETLSLKERGEQLRKEINNGK